MSASSSSRADTEVQRLRDAAGRAIAERAAAETRLSILANASGPGAQPARYRWDDASPLARVPKAMLKAAPLDGVTNRLGALSIPVASALQFTDSEKASVQAALDRFVAGYNAALKTATRRVEPSAREMGMIGADAADVRMFEVTG